MFVRLLHLCSADDWLGKADMLSFSLKHDLETIAILETFHTVLADREVGATYAVTP